MRDWDSVRICDLGLTIRKSRLGRLVTRLRKEISAAGVRMRPLFYISTEWGTVIRTCNIAMLWTDLLDQIPPLARRYRGLVRPPEVLFRVLRHEAGHAFNYVHRIYRRRDFRRLFQVKGDFFNTYPDGGWSPNRRDEERLKKGEHINIRCLKHPDEDFAISFQTWVHPDVDWRRDYASQGGVLKKLEFVERMVEKFGRKPYKSNPRDLDIPIGGVTATVGDWFSSP